jgi:DNA polymerase-4
MHDAAWGRDDRPVVTESEPVSMSRETTFDRDLHAVRDRAELGAIFTDLCTRVAEDLQRKGYVGRTIGIKLRYDDFQTATRDHAGRIHRRPATIRRAAGQCLKRGGRLWPQAAPAGRARRQAGAATTRAAASNTATTRTGKPCAARTSLKECRPSARPCRAYAPAWRATWHRAAMRP